MRESLRAPACTVAAYEPSRLPRRLMTCERWIRAPAIFK